VRDDSREPGPHDWSPMPDPEGTDPQDEPGWGNCRKCRRLGHLYPESVIGRVAEICRDCSYVMEIP
jgi:hypothetical protein